MNQPWRKQVPGSKELCQLVFPGCEAYVPGAVPAEEPLDELYPGAEDFNANKGFLDILD